ncbi:MAG: hypothetical protein GY869_25255 [Planctomycetes bacterium]|nr:hypothetical protein [Planctomycetota bacterium]
MKNRKSFYAVGLVLILLAVMIVVKTGILPQFFPAPAVSQAVNDLPGEEISVPYFEPASTPEEPAIKQNETHIETGSKPARQTAVKQQQIPLISNQPTAGLELKGTMIGPPEKSRAIITDRATGSTGTYKIGDAIGGGRIVAINKDGVVIDFKGQTFELSPCVSHPVEDISELAPATTDPNYSLPDWIDKIGIRAGFMSSTKGNLAAIPRYIDAAKNMGLNTAIVYGCSFAETPNHIRYYREWLRLCNQAGLHVFAFYPWQPPVGNTCRPVVFSDGKEGLFPCPLDEKLWQDYLTADMAVKLAGLSFEGPQSSFDGYFLDMEMYRTEKQPVDKRDYSYETCFCDFCFSSFITNRTQLTKVPTTRKSRRKLWLTNNEYLSDYHAYLESEVEKNAAELKKSIHAINPKLLFGVYPALNDTSWVRNAVMRALGRDSYPVISFTTDTYGYHGNRAYPSTWGAERIPDDMDNYFDKYDINGIYVAGYLFRLYKSSEIKDHLIKSQLRAQGYWLFRIPQLVDDDNPELERLAGGTQTEYIRAIKDAKTYIRKP